MFMGTYYLNMDESHRLNIPTPLKKYLETDLVLSKTIDTDYPCLWLFNKNDWEKQVAIVNSLPIFQKRNRLIQREFNGNSYPNSLDPKGRLVVNKELLPYSQLTKECVIIGSGDKIEIWDKSIYDKYLSETAGMLEQESEEITY